MDAQAAAAGFNTLDYAVFGVILVSGLLALLRGLVREFFSLIAWIVAYYCAARFYPLAKPWSHYYFKSEEGANIVAILGVFCASFVIMSLIGSVVAAIIKGPALTAIDRSLGFVFGLLRGVLVVAIIYLCAASILWPDMDKPEAEQDKNHKPAPDMVMNAKTRPAIAIAAQELRAFIPQGEVDKMMQKYMEEKAAAQHEVESKKLEMLSTPVPVSDKPQQAPAYNDRNREGMNNLVNQGTRP